MTRVHDARIGKHLPSFTEEQASELVNPNPPVHADEKAIQIDTKRMDLKIGYSVMFKGKAYVVTKPKEGIIDLYEL